MNIKDTINIYNNMVLFEYKKHKYKLNNINLLLIPKTNI